MIKSLVDGIRSANQELSILLRDRDSPQELGPPCTRQQIARIGQVFGRLGARVPESFRSFLELHNGWSGFAGEAKILSVEDQDADWVRRIASRSHEFVGADSPFIRMVPILLTMDSVVQMVFLDPSSAESSSEVGIVAYEHLEEEARFASFEAYLEARLHILNLAIESQTNGDAPPP